MKKNKFISVVLITVFILQLLPVQQAIHYFFIDNVTMEEIVHCSKAPVKPPAFTDEDHLLSELHPFEHPSSFNYITLSVLTVEILPAFLTEDVETPPPNVMVL